MEVKGEVCAFSCFLSVRCKNELQAADPLLWLRQPAARITEVLDQEVKPTRNYKIKRTLCVCVCQVDMNFMKKIPHGAEASNVLVGEVDFLERPIIAFVRLCPAVLLTGLTEVPVPTR